MVLSKITTGIREVTVSNSTPDLISNTKENINTERIRLILVNTSTGGQTIRIGIDSEPTSGIGIPLYPGGSITWEKTNPSFPIMQKMVYALSSAVGGTLSIYEEVVI